MKTRKSQNILYMNAYPYPYVFHALGQLRGAHELHGGRAEIQIEIRNEARDGSFQGALGSRVRGLEFGVSGSRFQVVNVLRSRVGWLLWAGVLLGLLVNSALLYICICILYTYSRCAVRGTVSESGAAYTEVRTYARTYIHHSLTSYLLITRYKM